MPHPSRSAIGLDEPSDKFLTWATHGQYDQLGGVINDEVQARLDFMNPKRGRFIYEAAGRFWPVVTSSSSREANHSPDQAF